MTMLPRVLSGMAGYCSAQKLRLSVRAARGIRTLGCRAAASIAAYMKERFCHSGLVTSFALAGALLMKEMISAMDTEPPAA